MTSATTPKITKRSRRRDARRTSTGIALACALAAATVGLAAVPALQAAPAQAATALPTVTLKWSHSFGISGKPVALASPMVASLNSKGPVVLIGDRAGYERAYYLADGTAVGGRYPVNAGAAIDSTPSVIGTGSSTKTFWGEGNSGAPSVGQYKAMDAGGATIWKVKAGAAPTGTATRGIQSSLAIGNMKSTYDVISGSMGQMQDMINAFTGKVEPGFPWFQADSNFTTPAVVDPGNSGHDEIVEGGDSTAGNALGNQYQNGGHIRILGAAGHSTNSNLAAGLRCEHKTNQVVQSSPAVGNFLAGNKFGIAVGTGSFYSGASDTGKLFIVNGDCNVVYDENLGGITDSSPAVANLLGGTKQYVIQGTRISATSGKVYAIDPATGHALWWNQIPGGVYGGITTADLTGDGTQDVIVPTPTGVYVLNAKTGHGDLVFGKGYGFQNSALVTKDPDGHVGITVAGYNSANQGVILHYEVNNSDGSKVDVKGAWPMFHHDQKLTGNAGTPLPTNY